MIRLMPLDKPRATARRSPPPPYLAREAPGWITRAVGHVMLVIGLLLFGLSLLGVYRGMTPGSALSRPTTLLAVVAIGLAIATCCTLLGARLVSGRSPHRDSLLSRPAWTVLGVGFALFAASGAIMLPWSVETSTGLWSGALLAVGCLGVASRPRRR